MKYSTVQKYDRASVHYDRMEGLVEKFFFARFRRLAAARARGQVLEIGAGTGKNFPYYPSGIRVSAIDFSKGMLRQAAEKKQQLEMPNVSLLEMDVERLVFPDNTFDTAIATFVFCTVPNPMRGLAEVLRVLKPGGRAVFLEHMKSSRLLVNLPLYLMNPFTRRLLGTSMLRETQKNIAASGFKILHTRHLLLDVVRLIIAQKAE